MKKKYTKPVIIFEDFSLSTSISAGCEMLTNLPSVDSCGIQYGPYELFTSSACSKGNEGLTPFPVSDSYVHDGHCYHNPSDDRNLFASQ